MSGGGTTVTRAATAALRFLLGVGALLALGYWGHQSDEGAVSYGLAVGVPLLVAVVRAVFGRLPHHAGSTVSRDHSTRR